MPLLLTLLFMQCASKHQQDANKLNNEGLKYLEMGDERSAIFTLHKALEQIQKDKKLQAKILRNLGIAYKQKFVRDKLNSHNALDSAGFYFFNAANKSDINSFDYELNMGDLSLVRDKIDSAIFYLEKAYNLNPNESSVNNVLGLIFLGEEGRDFFDPGKALKYNLTTYRLNPGRLSKFVLGKNYMYLQEYSNAEPLFLDLYKQFPDFVDYLFALIVIEKKLGKIDESSKYLELLKKRDFNQYKSFIDKFY